MSRWHAHTHTPTPSGTRVAYAPSEQIHAFNDCLYTHGGKTRKHKRTYTLTTRIRWADHPGATHARTHRTHTHAACVRACYRTCFTRYQWSKSSICGGIMCILCLSAGSGVWWWRHGAAARGCKHTICCACNRLKLNHMRTMLYTRSFIVRCFIVCELMDL